MANKDNNTNKVEQENEMEKFTSKIKEEYCAFPQG